MQNYIAKCACSVVSNYLQPHVQGVVAVRAQEGLEEPSHIEGQEGQWEEIPLIQGKEQWLCFPGAAVKRYAMPKVRETQVRW